MKVRWLKLEGNAFHRRNWQISPRSSDPQPWKSSQPRFCAKRRCIRSSQKCHAQVKQISGRGVSGESEDAKTPLCTTWRYGFARSRRDLTICVAKRGACSSRFLFRKAASDPWRPGSALLRREPYRWWREKGYRKFGLLPRSPPAARRQPEWNPGSLPEM